MSHGYFESFGQGGFVIHEDDAENVPAAMPGKTMRNELQHRALQVKRTALGSIANNDHSQPFRAAAKQNQVCLLTFNNYFIMSILSNEECEQKLKLKIGFAFKKEIGSLLKLVFVVVGL